MPWQRLSLFCNAVELSSALTGVVQRNFVQKEYVFDLSDLVLLGYRVGRVCNVASCRRQIR